MSSMHALHCRALIKPDTHKQHTHISCIHTSVCMYMYMYMVPPIHPHFPCTYSFGRFSFAVRCADKQYFRTGKTWGQGGVQTKNSFLLIRPVVSRTQIGLLTPRYQTQTCSRVFEPSDSCTCRGWPMTRFDILVAPSCFSSCFGSLSSTKPLGCCILPIRAPLCSHGCILFHQKAADQNA